MKYSSSKQFEKVGVIGAGRFGVAIASLIAENGFEVILYLREASKQLLYEKESSINGQKIHKNITLSNNLSHVTKQCEVLFPIIPSVNFRHLIRQMSPFLEPYHIIIHGIKGFDFVDEENKSPTKKSIKTISKVVMEETNVLRVGCLAGPNLSTELNRHKPAATVIASPYDEVIDVGRKILKSHRFMVYGTKDIRGVELCGVLKNIFAIGAGCIDGLSLGENAKAFYISRGLVEMIYLGQFFGAEISPFLGLAGIGDLIATCSSNESRNFAVGKQLSMKKSLQEILSSIDEVAEGVRTIEIIHKIAQIHQERFPITETIYRLLHGKVEPKEAQNFLMNFPFRQEIDFIKNKKKSNKNDY